MPAPRRRAHPLKSEINVVPYIDVMLVLLVIFMITTPLMTQGVEIKLPQAAAKSIDETPQTPLIVSVDAQGRWYLNVNARPLEPMAPSILLNRVAAEIQLNQQRGNKRPVYVKGDASARYEQIIEAMAALQQAGVEHIGLLTHPPDSSRGKHA